MAIAYTPEGRKDVRNFPRRVYFSCHEKDLPLMDEVADQLRGITEDCVIAYREPGTVVDPNHFEEVEDFPLVVIPVTHTWFEEGIHQQEFDLFREKTKPMIPILFDGDLVETFNAHSGEMQLLRRDDPEYSEKLSRALQSFLVDQATVEAVERAFTHKLFIAYCREDLEQVRRLIRCIRQSEEGRRVSVWFDKYLQVGRNFEEVIFSKLDESQLFGMVLTPHLVQRDTYVKRQEYPRALEGDKEMVVFQLADADWKSLLTELERIAAERGYSFPEGRLPVQVGRDEGFVSYVKKLLREVEGTDDVEEKRELNYLLGVAYRNGIGVEFDYRYAMKKFKAAAEEGEYRSAHCLAEMFLNGVGVRRDLKQAKKWYIREIEYLFEEYKKFVIELKSIPIPIVEMKDGTKMDPRQEFLEMAKKDILGMAGKLVGQASLNARILRDHGFLDEAEGLYRMAQKALAWSENNVNQIGVTAKYGDSVENELNQFLLYRGKSDPKICRKAWEKALAAFDSENADSCFTAVKSGHNYALALMLEQQGADALKVMEQAVALIERAHVPLPQRTREIQLQLYRDMGRSYLLLDADEGPLRAEYAKRAVGVLKKEMELFEKYPFDTVENPYLRFKLPQNSLFQAEAHFYGKDYENAILCGVKALDETERLREEWGELASRRDMPPAFLQLYAEIARFLSRFQGIPEEQLNRLRGISEQYEKMEYNGEYRLLAQEYLKKLKEALKPQTAEDA